MLRANWSKAEVKTCTMCQEIHQGHILLADPGVGIHRASGTRAHETKLFHFHTVFGENWPT